MNKKILLGAAVLAAASMSFGLVTWNGSNAEYRIDTELDDGGDESGYWFSYDDQSNDGTSSITWPCDTGNEYDDNALDPIIDECGGLCGDVALGAGYDYPFVGVGFNLSGPDQAGNDITSWGGVCVKYEADGIAPILELGPEDEADYTEYNNYTTTLSLSATEADVAWSKFKQESGWGKKQDQAEYLTKVAAIKFKFSGKAGTSGHFNIKMIGESGKCSGKVAIDAQKATSAVKAMLSGRTLSFAGISSATAEVINLQGQVVLKSAVSASSALNLASLDAGVYMVRVQGQGIASAQKIVLK